MQSNITFTDEMEEFLSKSKGNRYDKAARVYRMIMESSEPKDAFRYFLENGDNISSSEEEEVEGYFTAEQLKTYRRQYAELVDGLLKKLIDRHYEEDEFYNELWESVSADVIFDGEDAKIYALGRIWSDARIPYFHLKQGMRMSDEEFIGIIRDNRELLQEATFIIGAQYEQRTETSSLLLELLGKCKDDKERAVVMSKIIDLVERRCLDSIIKRR